MTTQPTSGEFAEEMMRSEYPTADFIPDVQPVKVHATRIAELEKELADTKRELEMVRNVACKRTSPT
jgi:hypothetical protein